jgi:hypothetical protein
MIQVLSHTYVLSPHKLETTPVCTTLHMVIDHPCTRAVCVGGVTWLSGARISSALFVPPDPRPSACSIPVWYFYKSGLGFALVLLVLHTC